jgi:hypothetical protein
MRNQQISGRVVRNQSPSSLAGSKRQMIATRPAQDDPGPTTQDSSNWPPGSCHAGLLRPTSRSRPCAEVPRYVGKKNRGARALFAPRCQTWPIKATALHIRPGPRSLIVCLSRRCSATSTITAGKAAGQAPRKDWASASLARKPSCANFLRLRPPLTELESRPLSLLPPRSPSSSKFRSVRAWDVGFCPRADDHGRWNLNAQRIVARRSSHTE